MLDNIFSFSIEIQLVRAKKKIVALLIGLVAWNGVLGGVDGLLMCLHAAGSLHIASLAPEKACCHSTDEASIHQCSNCNDLELSSVDMLASRDSDTLLKNLPTDLAVIVPIPELVWKTENKLGPNPTRAPPYSVNVCLLVAETVVLLI
ncbi:hypothetical protein [Cerasicoccus fimbriatus]|uniref:hypothetical protein n=1 Tax=Cerasicoccus fimbriatus TaxID=3014554 RepID=UPI0022B365FA|nr:hypothetical protein [Cerasicoccus sp. TK19100]